MRILKQETQFRFKEIHVESKFLWIKQRRIYRKYRGGTILQFDGKDKYKSVGIREYLDLDDLFSTCDPFVESKTNN